MGRVAEDLVADREPGDVRAEGVDHPGGLPAEHDRHLERHEVLQESGPDLPVGYFLDTGVGAANQGFIAPNPKTAMAFQVQCPTQGFGQVRVKPVMETPDGWVPVGPNVPLRVGMTGYRWSLAFGELILNWTDFLASDPG